ncbi:hypothetical protein KIL84_002437 [Mauremys mutica]|uniref:Uncharacterized protein n=1 Tax=Mauremys mutica TaxID=74926 RepID=A0A9D3X7I5_9SAUR|nr:hypothetical protein KIL84_002437 [Mauremys mutica]
MQVADPWEERGGADSRREGVWLHPRVCVCPPPLPAAKGRAAVTASGRPGPKRCPKCTAAPLPACPSSTGPFCQGPAAPQANCSVPRPRYHHTTHSTRLETPPPGLSLAQVSPGGRMPPCPSPHPKFCSLLR